MLFFTPFLFALSQDEAKTLQVSSVHLVPCSHLLNSVFCDVMMEEVLLLAVLAGCLIKKIENWVKR